MIPTLLIGTGLALLMFSALIVWGVVAGRFREMYCAQCNLYTSRRRCPLCLRKMRKAGRER